MENEKKLYPYHLLLLLLFYLLHHYNEIFGFIPLRQIFYYSLVGLVTGIVFLLFYLVYRSSQKAGVTTFLLLFFFLFFGPYHDLLKSNLPNSVFSSYKVVVPLSLSVIAVLVIYLNKKPGLLARFSRYLNLLLVILCTVEIAFFLINGGKFVKNKNLIFPELAMCKKYVSPNLPDSMKPDIYYLVFDEYTNDNTLQQIWHFDNSYITNWLSDRGFYIIPQSRSNYTTTPFSISAALNMNYIDKRKGHIGSGVNYLQANQSLSTNETFCILNKESYIIRFIAPFKNSIEDHGLVQYFDYLPEQQLYSSTFLGRFERDILWNFKKSSNRPTKPSRDFIRKAIDTENTITKIKASTDHHINRKPKFVYGHFLITHEPHIFDSTGNIRTPADVRDNYDPFKTYTQQVVHANKVIKDLVNHIQVTNKKRTVIIIQGDHGYRNLPAPIERNYFSIIHAVYFPDQKYTGLYPELSPVNTFRNLFNHYFYQKFERLKDSSIVVRRL